MLMVMQTVYGLQMFLIPSIYAHNLIPSMFMLNGYYALMPFETRCLIQFLGLVILPLF